MRSNEQRTSLPPPRAMMEFHDYYTPERRNPIRCGMEAPLHCTSSTWLKKGILSRNDSGCQKIGLVVKAIKVRWRKPAKEGKMAALAAGRAGSGGLGGLRIRRLWE
jgi:hypothetical protein